MNSLRDVAREHLINNDTIQVFVIRAEKRKPSNPDIFPNFSLHNEGRPALRQRQRQSDASLVINYSDRTGRKSLGPDIASP